jgi:uncharacterized protein
MLVGNQISTFHRLKSVELWHHYLGSSLKVFLISQDGKLDIVTLGKDYRENEVVQLVTKKGIWFAASVTDENSFALIGATVSPGFDRQDWELEQTESLSRLYPQHKKIIECYTST